MKTETNEIKNRIEEILLATKRDGIDGLVEVMESIGFYDAPASSGNGRHSAEPGGLAVHSLLVYEGAMKLKKAFDVPDNDVPNSSLAIACLLHDLGKSGDHRKPFYVANVLKSGKLSDAKPWERNKNLTNIPHAIRSVVVAERWIDLTEDEEYAIMYHDGLYDRETGGTSVLPGHETKLLLLLHWADMWASRMVEGTPEEGRWLEAIENEWEKLPFS